MTIGVVAGFAFLFIVPALRHDAAEEERLTYIVVGTVITAIGLVIAFFTIRCPACGSRWMTRAAKQHTSQWLRWLLALQKCPDCGSNGHTAT